MAKHQIQSTSTDVSAPISGPPVIAKELSLNGAGLEERRGSAELLRQDDPEKPNLRILRAIRRIIRGVDLYSKELTASTRITTPQLMCLLSVVQAGSMTATSISREIHVSPSTVVGILDRLEEKGLIRRERNRDDRRVVAVTATNEGCRIAQQAPSPLQKTLADALGSLPLDEQTKIAGSLERIVNLMEAQHIDAAPILDTGPLNQP